MSNLLGFVLNTVSDWADDPNNQQFFFPQFLARVENGKYVPYQVAQWNLGASPALTEQSGPAICNNWAIIQDSFPTGDQGIASSDAMLVMTNVTISGLNNLLIGNPVITQLSGNQAQAAYVSRLNQYPANVAAQFGVAGSFSLTQPCCSAPALTNQCDGEMSDQITGTGTFTANLQADQDGTPQQVSLTLVLSFQEGPFQVGVSIPANGIEVQGSLNVSNIVINNDDQGYGWTQAAQFLFSQQQTKDQVLAAFNTQLNLPDNLQALQKAIQQQLNTSIQQIAGASSPKSNVPSDQFFIDLIETGLNDPSSRIYLPTMVQRSTDPVLEPLTIISGTKDLGQQTIPQIDVQVDVQLTNVGLAGLSNAQVTPDNVQIDGDLVTFLAQFSRLPNLPQQLTLSGAIQLSNQQDGTLAGTFSIDITNASLQGVCAITGQDAGSIQLTFQQLVLQPLPAGSVTATVNLQDTSQFFDNLVAKLIESSSVLSLVVSQINNAIAGNLTKLSQQITLAAQSILKNGLGNSAGAARY